MASITWDSGFNQSPTIADRVRNTPVFIQQSRAAMQERLAVEHCLDLTDGGGQSDHGKHLRGSARAFVSDTDVADPTTVTADDGNYATGRLQVYPTLRRLGYYNGSAWVDLVRNSSGQLFSEVATGTAPMVVASTTKVVNLNADLLDDYSAGNSSGNIPLNNGTVNTDLNADKLDGYDANEINIASTIPVRSSAKAIKTFLARNTLLDDTSMTANEIFDSMAANLGTTGNFNVVGFLREHSTGSLLLFHSLSMSSSNVRFVGWRLSSSGTPETSPTEIILANGGVTLWDISMSY